MRTSIGEVKDESKEEQGNPQNGFSIFVWEGTSPREVALRSLWATTLLFFLAGGCGSGNNERSDQGTTPLSFSDVTESAGLGSFRHVTGAYGSKLFPEPMGGGGGFIDYDGDGRLDLLLVGGGYWPHNTDSKTPAVELYRNVSRQSDSAGSPGRTDLRFKRVTREVGLGGVTGYPMGVTVADYNGDGERDFYLSMLNRDRLFENQNGNFVDVTGKVGLDSDTTWSTATVFFDPDQDGDLDLYVGKYVRWSKESDIACSLDNEHLAYCTPEIYEGLPARFYENQGDGTFVERSEEVGIAPEPGMTLGAVPLDYNEDGLPDLAVANDTKPNLLYRNQGNGTFEEVGIRSGMALSADGRARAGMGIDAGVVDSTGRSSIFVGNFSDEQVGVFQSQNEGLFLDRGRTSSVGRLTYRQLTFGLFLADINLDTHLDLFLANGHIQKEVEHLEADISYRQRPQLFVNRGDGAFVEHRNQDKSPLTDSLVARGAAYGDVDGDGDLDILVTENGGPAHLWRNNGRPEGRSLRVHLRSSESAPDGIGARISAYLDQFQMVRRIKTGGSYLSSSESQVATFGLGEKSCIDSLIVQWPSGRKTVKTDVSGGGQLLIRESEALVSDSDL